MSMVERRYVWMHVCIYMCLYITGVCNVCKHVHMLMCVYEIVCTSIHMYVCT